MYEVSTLQMCVLMSIAGLHGFVFGLVFGWIARVRASKRAE